jgi:outer membrane protein OmpA-like peptidoglycan-associated protein
MKIYPFFLLLISTTQLFSQDLKPTLTQALLKVVVVNDKEKPQVDQAVSFISVKDAKTYNGTTGADGKFAILVPPGQKYKVKYKVFTTVESDLLLDMPTMAGAYTMDYKITITPPKNFTLDNVFFDSGKSSLRPESNKELNELAEYMSLKKTLVIEIAGHTDNVGAPESNQKLSEDRANAVKQYLVKKGIVAERIVAKGYGDSEPVADNNTASGKQQNRRTEVRVIAE